MRRAAPLPPLFLLAATLAGCAGSESDSAATLQQIQGPGSSIVILPGVVIGPPRNPRTEASRDPNIVRVEILQLKADLSAGRKQVKTLDAYDRELLQLMQAYRMKAAKSGRSSPL
ncbi:hypothetical protein BH11PLA1_BH11PLA1_12540 [soil metagenome]